MSERVKWFSRFLSFSFIKKKKKIQNFSLQSFCTKSVRLLLISLKINLPISASSFFPSFFSPFLPFLTKGGGGKPIYILDKKGKIIITTTRQGKKALSSLPSLNSHPLWFSSSKKPHSPNDRSLTPMISPPAPKPWRRELGKKNEEINIFFSKKRKTFPVVFRWLVYARFRWYEWLYTGGSSKTKTPLYSF